jgi:hypothetical protein
MRIALSFLLLLSHATLASAGVIELGDQDFMDGSLVNLDEFNSRSFGENAPFNGFIASDLGGPAFSATFTFQFDPTQVHSADLTLGLFDHDSAAAGSQVASFTLGGFDLTDLLDVQLEQRGGSQIEYNVYSIQIPFQFFAELEDGTATFSLTLQPPGLGGNPPNGFELLPGNGAGLDFARLRVNVPEPENTALFALAALSLMAAARHVRRRHG